MEKASESFLEMMKQAIIIEKEGYKLYMETCEKINDQLAKRVFHALANDEKKHIKALNEFYKNECKTKSCPNVKELFKKSHQEAREEILGKHKIAAKELKPDIKLLEVYDLAMNLEKEGYNFYKKALEKAGSDDEKRLVEFLLGEENAHFKVLKETKEYIENPQSWFLEDEKPIVEG